MRSIEDYKYESPGRRDENMIIELDTRIDMVQNFDQSNDEEDDHLPA